MLGPLSNIKTPSSGGQRLSSIYPSTMSNLKERLTMSQSRFTFDKTDNEIVHNKASSINSFAYPVALFVQRLCCLCLSKCLDKGLSRITADKDT